MEKKILPYLVVISALSVSLSAAFYSVTGIGKMFSGSSTNVMIMMTSLEVAKLVLASLLYQYWNKLNTALKSYYFIAIFTLMVITSAGIYGYLSSAYSETSYKMENVSKQVGVLDIKRDMFKTQLDDIRLEKQKINDNIADLTKGLSNNNQSRKDKSGNIITTTSSANRKAFEVQLSSSQKRRDDLNLKETSLNDSIVKIDLQKLELETNSDLASEIGPLKYISSITGQSIDVVVNWFIIALMFVFDPLAVSLVVGANVIFKDRNKDKERKDSIKKTEDNIEDIKRLESELESKKKEIFENESKLKEREKELLDNFSKMENELLDRKSKLEMDIEEMDKDINDKTKELDSRVEELRKEEEELKSRILEGEERLKNINIEIENEKKSIINQKKELDKEAFFLKEDKEDLKLEYEKLKNLKQRLEFERKDIENKKDELERINDEIKAWESTHWKMRRNPPPSAILD